MHVTYQCNANLLLENVCDAYTSALPCPALPPTAVAKLCQQQGIGHIINNAYGVQSAALCAQVGVPGTAGAIAAP